MTAPAQPRSMEASSALAPSVTDSDAHQRTKYDLQEPETNPLDRRHCSV